MSRLFQRTHQILQYLQLMETRRTGTGKSDCFLIFAMPAHESVQHELVGAAKRIVQFAFLPDAYYLDLPDTTVTFAESKLIAAMPEYDFALNRKNKRLDERQFDPLQRYFTYRQHAEAAADTAYFFFDFWQTPLEAPLTITSAAFDIESDWEDGLVLN